MDMSFEEVRKWVRNELDPADRRRVGRWLMRSTDPQLPELLQQLILEHQEELADKGLRTRLPHRAFLVDLWQRLAQLGDAVLVPVAGTGIPVQAHLGTASSGGGLSLRRVGEEVLLDLSLLDGPLLVSVLATTDQGEEHLLLRPTTLEAGRWAGVGAWEPEAHEGRVTFWLCRAPVGADPATLAEMAVASRTANVEIRAVRWGDFPES